jgi:hypothetical protein
MYIQAAREGRIRLDGGPPKSATQEPEVFEMWTPEGDAETEEARNRGPMHLPAPKVSSSGYCSLTQGVHAIYSSMCVYQIIQVGEDVYAGGGCEGGGGAQPRTHAPARVKGELFY